MTYVIFNETNPDRRKALNGYAELTGDVNNWTAFWSSGLDNPFQFETEAEAVRVAERLFDFWMIEFIDQVTRDPYPPHIAVYEWQDGLGERVWAREYVPGR